MKVLYIIGARMPTEKAYGVQVAKMCEAFAKAGHEVTLAFPSSRHEHEDLFSYYGIRPTFELRQVFSFGWRWGERASFVLQTFFFALRMGWHVIFTKYDMVYGRGEELPLLLMSMVSPNVVWEAHMPRDNVWSKVLLRRVSKVVVISKGLQQFFVSRGVAPERILVAHDGVDLDDFSVETDAREMRRKLGFPLDKPLALYIGRLDPWKGVETLLRAAQIMKDIHVGIIGEGSELERFRNAYPKVTFIGPRPYKELPFNQCAADVLVIPNSGKSVVSARYTSPLKVFAHMASGVPIVASDLPSLREVLNEQNAVLVEPDAPEKLATALERLVRDKSQSAALSAQAFRDVQSYSWSRRAASILTFVGKHGT